MDLILQFHASGNKIRMDRYEPVLLIFPRKDPDTAIYEVYVTDLCQP